MSAVPLTTLPFEILHQILLHLDTADLLQTSRTSRLLRSLSLDPLLHQARRQIASSSLSHALAQRPSRASLCPPHAWIWLSKTNVLSRSISKSLIKIRLSHNLERRPGIHELVQRAILPAAACVSVGGGRKGGLVVSPMILVRGEDVRKRRLKDWLGRMLQRRPDVRKLVELNIIPEECARLTSSGRGTRVSPMLVETRRRVMKERLKDGLRNWVEKRAILEQRRREEGEERLGVKALVRRMTLRSLSEEIDNVTMEKRHAQRKWGKQLEVGKRKEGCSQPSRAHVLGLRRFWEDVIKTAAV